VPVGTVKSLYSSTRRNKVSVFVSVQSSHFMSGPVANTVSVMCASGHSQVTLFFDPNKQSERIRLRAVKSFYVWARCKYSECHVCQWAQSSHFMSWPVAHKVSVFVSRQSSHVIPRPVANKVSVFVSRHSSGHSQVTLCLGPLRIK
jgi:hypothetical protein